VHRHGRRDRREAARHEEETRTSFALVPEPQAVGAMLIGMSKHRVMTLLLLAGCLALVPAATARPLVRGARAAASSRQAACVASQLVVWLDTAGNGAAGSVYYTLKFTNLSSHSKATPGCRR
jgi:hypothetical protein